MQKKGAGAKLPRWHRRFLQRLLRVRRPGSFSPASSPAQLRAPPQVGPCPAQQCRPPSPASDVRVSPPPGRDLKLCTSLRALVAAPAPPCPAPRPRQLRQSGEICSQASSCPTSSPSPSWPSALQGRVSDNSLALGKNIFNSLEPYCIFII